MSGSAQTHITQLPRPENQFRPNNCHDDDDDGGDDNDDDDEEKMATSNASRLMKTGNRIECLDGLRGIACIAVFNYHFFWPWTKSIMLGNGFFGPLSPEPYMNWFSLPVICLLHRGRAMVAIFFAISGYVLCRRIIRSIHDRDWDAVHRSLASSVFRRIFRLYIPPTISMLLVAFLAQTGAFPSEKDVYSGPDSVYINGSLVYARPGDVCDLSFIPVAGASGMAQVMGLRTAEYLGNGSSLPNKLCLRNTSLLLGPVELYRMVRQLEAPTAVGPEKPSDTSLHLVQYGGSWEEHPFIHENLTDAVQNFTRAYAEWANPFNFNPYHTRYDPHTYTMPIELRGSMLMYIFLLGTFGLKTIWRLSLASAISVYCLFMGRWDMAIFQGATMLSDLDVWNPLISAPPIIRYRSINHLRKKPLSLRGSTIIRWIVFIVALYLLSYPDIGAEHTPGFVFLSWLVPRYYLPLAGWMFYHSIGALLLIPCIVRSHHLCRVLESPLAQYLGKLSFAIYLVHGPLLHSLGFWIMPRLFERFGRTGGYLIGWAVLFTTTMCLAQWWYRKVDLWSTTVGRRIERYLTHQV
ncbi:hypothetical protein E4U41_001065 [Claviceps citrina]|nr:hypothetical protein E4U41_001065 [Claviceps citrina]